MDSAFPTGAYPGYTTTELNGMYQNARNSVGPEYAAKAAKMKAEIDRRYAVAKGDMSAMTPGERLRFVKSAGEDLTPEGVQFVMPGCEKDRTKGKPQMELF